MATYTTYDQVGIKEDIADIITNITPTKTPFQSMIGSEKVSNRLFQWQEDSLASANTSNKNIEGFTAVDATLSATTLRTNYTQILQKTIKVSGTSDVVDTYGRGKESAYQIAKGMAEVKRDLEAIYVGAVQAANAGNSSSLHRVMASALSMFGANTNANSAITRALVDSCAEAVYANGGEPTVLMVKPADAQDVAAFAGEANRYGRTLNDGTTKLVNAVDVYVSPYGPLKVVINRFLKITHALLLDPDMWKKAVLRNWTRTMLAKDGDSEKHLIVGEFSLKHLNFLASGVIDNLTS